MTTLQEKKNEKIKECIHIIERAMKHNDAILNIFFKFVTRTASGADKANEIISLFKDHYGYNDDLIFFYSNTNHTDGSSFMQKIVIKETIELLSEKATLIEILLHLNIMDESINTVIDYSPIAYLLRYISQRAKYFQNSYQPCNGKLIDIFIANFKDSSRKDSRRKTSMINDMKRVCKFRHSENRDDSPLHACNDIEKKLRLDILNKRQIDFIDKFLNFNFSSQDSIKTTYNVQLNNDFISKFQKTVNAFIDSFQEIEDTIHDKNLTASSQNLQSYQSLCKEYKATASLPEVMQSESTEEYSKDFILHEDAMRIIAVYNYICDFEQHVNDILTDELLRQIKEIENNKTSAAKILLDKKETIQQEILKHDEKLIEKINAQNEEIIQKTTTVQEDELSQQDNNVLFSYQGKHKAVAKDHKNTLKTAPKNELVQENIELIQKLFDINTTAMKYDVLASLITRLGAFVKMSRSGSSHATIVSSDNTVKSTIVKPHGKNRDNMVRGENLNKVRVAIDELLTPGWQEELLASYPTTKLRVKLKQ